MMLSILHALGMAQFNEKLSGKVTLSVNTNIETYFNGAKLTVDWIMKTR